MLCPLSAGSKGNHHSAAQRGTGYSDGDRVAEQATALRSLPERLLDASF